jgi:hypothetical protein
VGSSLPQPSAQKRHLFWKRRSIDPDASTVVLGRRSIPARSVARRLGLAYPCCAPFHQRARPHRRCPAYPKLRGDLELPPHPPGRGQPRQRGSGCAAGMLMLHSPSPRGDGAAEIVRSPPRSRRASIAGERSPGKISVLFWLDNLLSALRGEYSIHDGKQQGLFLRQLIEGPSSPNSPARSRNYRSFAAPRSSARPPSITIRTRTMPWPATTRLRTRSATPARSLATR